MIYIADISGCDPQNLIPLVCRERAEYAKRYKQEPDRVRSLSVAVLLSEALRREGYTGKLPVTLLHDAEQKPYIAESDQQSVNINEVNINYNPCFSLTHAGDYVAVALDDVPVGIDIEKIRPYKESLTKRYFGKEEQDMIGTAPDPEKDRMFTTIWTLKESFLKMTGRGLQFGLDSFSVTPAKEAGTFSYRHQFDKEEYIGKVFNAPDGYVLSVCMRTTGSLNAEARDIHYVNLQEAI